MCRRALGLAHSQGFPLLFPLWRLLSQGVTSEEEFQPLRQVSPSTQCAEPAGPLADLRAVRSFHLISRVPAPPSPGSTASRGFIRCLGIIPVTPKGC